MKRILLSSASIRPYVNRSNQTEEGQAANRWALHWLADLVRELELARAEKRAA